jgi:excisionase family DNA binding protein
MADLPHIPDAVPSQNDLLLLTKKEVARRTSLSERKISELIAAGDLPVVRVGRAVRVLASSLESWAAAREKGGADGHSR